MLGAGYRSSLIWIGLAIGIAGFCRGALTNPSALEPLWSGNSWIWLAVLAAAAVLAALAQGASRRSQLLTPLLGGAVTLAAFGFGAFAAVALILVSAFALGAWLLHSAPTSAPAVSDTSTNTIVGLSMLSLLLGLTAHWRVNVPAFYLALSAVSIGLGWRHVRDAWRAFVASASSDRQVEVPYLIRVALWFAFGLHLAYAALPERYPDALSMHLLVARAMELFGRWDFNVREYVWAVQPMGANWLFSWAYVLGGEHAAMLLNATFLILISSTLVDSRAVSPRPAWLAVTILALTPLAFVESASLFVENALTMFCVAAIILATRLREPDSPMRMASFALVSAAAMAVKLHGVIAIACTCAALFLFGGWRELYRSDRRTTLICLVAIGAGLLPYAYAWYATANPVFPYFNGIFKSAFYPPESFTISTYPGGLSLTDFYELTFSSSKYLEAYDGAAGFAIPLLLPAGLLVVAVAGSRQMRFITIVAIAYVAAILLNTRYIRYVFPAFPLLALVLVYPLAVARAAPARAAVVLAATVGILFGVLRIPAAGWILYHLDLPAAFSTHAKELLLESAVPMRKLARIQAAIGNDDSRVLIFGWPVGADIRGRPIYTNWHFMPFYTIAPKVNSPEDAAKALIELKITHLLFDQSDGPPEWIPWQKAAREYGRLIAQAGTGELYELDAHKLSSVDTSGPAIADELSAVDVFGPPGVPWQEWATDPPQRDTVSGGDLTLPAGVLISRSADLTKLPDDAEVSVSVKHVCQVPSAIRPQINWLTKDGSTLHVDAAVSVCDASPRTASVTGARPKGATVAYFYFVNQGDGSARLYDQRARAWTKP